MWEICSESYFFNVYIDSLFKNQEKWPKSLWKHWKKLDKEASLTRGGVVLGTVSVWPLMFGDFGPLNSMSLCIFHVCFFCIFKNHLTLTGMFNWNKIFSGRTQGCCLSTGQLPSWLAILALQGCGIIFDYVLFVPSQKIKKKREKKACLLV